MLHISGESMNTNEAAFRFYPQSEKNPDSCVQSLDEYSTLDYFL